MDVSPQVSANDPEKKPYQQPQLRVYGNIAEITCASATNGSMFDFRGDLLVDMRTQ